MSSHETLGLLLVRDGIITRPQLYDALRLQRQNHRLLGTCLLTLGYIEDRSLLEILSRQLAIPALPAGTLKHAAKEALSRVPGDVAVRLRIIPYSWDGDVLGVAVADGRALNHLHEVAFYSQSAIGAFVALEAEIEAVLHQAYPEEARVGLSPLPEMVPSPPLQGRMRPARIAPASEVPSRNFGTVLGLEENGEPVLLGSPKSPGRTPSTPVFSGAPPPASARQQPTPPPPASNNTPPAPARKDPGLTLLTRASFYDAVEKIYEVKTILGVGQFVGRALLNYFSRVITLWVHDARLEIVGYAGMPPPLPSIMLAQLPAVSAQLNCRRSITYGNASTDPRSAEITSAFGCGKAPTSLIAPIADSSTVHLLAYADNGEVLDLYEDLHDVELLFKEAETALRLLVGAD